MAKGNTAKEEVVNIIKAAFKNNYVGYDGKKYYVWVDDGGEKVQIAIALTCPKTYLNAEDTVQTVSTSGSAMISFDEPTPTKAAEISDEERATIAALMDKFNL